MYSNEASLTDTYGPVEVQALLKGKEGTDSDERMAKAAEAAATKIDGYLERGGYLLPIPAFTPYGETPADPPTPLNPMIQQLSDCLTAYNLSQSHDLQKDMYIRCYNDSIADLEKIANGLLPLKLPKADQPSGVVVTARPRVFVNNMPSVNDPFSLHN